MNAERLDVILPIVGSNINEQIWVKVKVSRNVPRGQVYWNFGGWQNWLQVLIKLGRFPARPDLNEAILEPDDLDDLDE